jgi:hypothetical protein
MVGWELWYTDGTVYTSDDGPWEDAPQFGIQALVRYTERDKGGVGAEIVNGNDLYTVDRPTALNIDLPPEVKIGEEMDREEFDKLMDRVRANIHSKIYNK